MASQKQIEANQRNAQLSTGPKGAESKAGVRCNALRDGLTGQVITLSDEERPFFDQLLNEILADFNPQSTLERKLAHAIAWDTWRLDHLRAVESNVYALGRHEQQAAKRHQRKRRKRQAIRTQPSPTPAPTRPNPRASNA